MHFNTGYQRRPASRSSERFADAFAGFDAVVTPSASCAAMVRHHHRAGWPRRRGDAGAAPSAVATVAPRVLELSEFLVDVLGVTDVGARFPHTVAFHPTCHSLRLLGVGDRPQRLLRRGRRPQPGRPARRRRSAAGSAGRSRSRTPTRRSRWATTRSTTCSATGAEVLTAGDTSCLMHIGGLLSRRRSPVRVMHLAEILAARGRRVTAPRVPARRRRPAADRPSRRSPARRRSRSGRGRRSPTTSCARTSAAATATIRDEAGRGPSPSAPTGRRSGSPAPRSRTRSCATCRRSSSSSRRT